MFTESEDEAIDHAAGETYPFLLRNNLHEGATCRGRLHSHRRRVEGIGHHRREEGSGTCRRLHDKESGDGARGSDGCIHGRDRDRGRRNGHAET
jgi:hypothetical protein